MSGLVRIVILHPFFSHRCFTFEVGDVVVAGSVVDKGWVVVGGLCGM